MNKLFAFGTFLLFLKTTLTHAQDNTLYPVQPGQKVIEAIPDSVEYVSPVFVKGKAHLKNGRAGTMVLNYNRLFEEIMFVDDKKDTVSIQNPEIFAYFVINTDTFYHHGTFYLRKLGEEGSFSLAERVFFTQSNIRKAGPLGAMPASVTADIINQAEYAIGYRNLIFNEFVDLKLKTDYYLGDAKNNFVLATKKNAQKIAKNKAKLKAFLENNTISFNNKEQVMLLLSHIQ